MAAKKKTTRKPAPSKAGLDRKIKTRVSRRFNLDKEYVDELRAYDDMVKMKWDLPPGLEEKAWAVKHVDPIAHDAEKTALNFFDTYNPQWNILPFGPEDQDRSEERESFLDWHMTLANSHGDTEPFRELLRYALRYDRVAAQMDYLPYWLPKDRSLWTQEQKEAVMSGPFCIYVHDTKSIYYEMGKYGLRWVAKIANVQASEILDHWLIYPQASTDTISKWLDEDENIRIVLIDYTDMDRRYVCGWRTEKDDIPQDIFESDEDFVVIYDDKNDLGFINWAIASGSSGSMFEALHHGDLWVNANRTASILRSDVYRTSFYPLGIEEGVGDDIEIDYSGDQITYKVPPGKKLTPIARPPVSPAWAEIYAQDQATMAQSTSIQTLAGVQPHSNVQFATVNAFIQLSLTNLIPYRRTAEKVLSQLGYMVFKWLRKNGAPEQAQYRRSTKTRRKGYRFTLSDGGFDPENMRIEAHFIANTPTDKLQLANIALQLIQSGMPIPMEEHMERLGYDNPEILKLAWEQEQVGKAALQFFIQQQQALMQLQLQAKVQQAQGQATPPSSPTPTTPGGGQFNPAMGGAPSAMAAPDNTQTQILSGRLEASNVTGPNGSSGNPGALSGTA